MKIAARIAPSLAECVLSIPAMLRTSHCAMFLTQAIDMRLSVRFWQRMVEEAEKLCCKLYSRHSCAEGVRKF